MTKVLVYVLVLNGHLATPKMPCSQLTTSTAVVYDIDLLLC